MVQVKEQIRERNQRYWTRTKDCGQRRSLEDASGYGGAGRVHGRLTFHFGGKGTQLELDFEKATRVELDGVGGLKEVRHFSREQETRSKRQRYETQER